MDELNKNKLMEVSNETNKATVEDSGLGTKVGIAEATIGTALILAVIGGVKVAKKAIIEHRAKKAIAELKVKNEEEFDEEVVIDDSEKEETE